MRVWGKLARAGFLAMGVSLLAGCSSTMVKTSPYAGGKLLVLPVPDAVKARDGVAVAGSGRAFQNQLVSNFSGSPFSAVPSGRDVRGLTKQAVLDEARRAGADYCLQTVLGKFHAAKSGAYRPDHAYLQGAWLYDAWTEKVVWELARPLYVEKSSGGNPSLLFKVMAAYTTDSIVQNVRPGAEADVARQRALAKNRYFYRQGLESARQGKLDEAVALFEAALHHDPTDADSGRAIRMARERLDRQGR